MIEQKYLEEMVQERRASTKKEERHDLLSSLLDANEGALESDAKLTDDALLGVHCRAYCAAYASWKPFYIGNIFMFLVAGYEVRLAACLYCCLRLRLMRACVDHVPHTCVRVHLPRALPGRTGEVLPEPQSCHASG